jgi:hypothetical protein
MSVVLPFSTFIMISYASFSIFDVFDLPYFIYEWQQ